MLSVGCLLTDCTLVAFAGEHVMQPLHYQSSLFLQSQCIAAALWQDVLVSANKWLALFHKTEML